MRQLFEEYGGPILAALAIMILIGIVKFAGGNANTQFTSLTDNFYQQVTDAQSGVASEASGSGSGSGSTTNP